jgi:hypothetical protein
MLFFKLFQLLKKAPGIKHQLFDFRSPAKFHAIEVNIYSKNLALSSFISLFVSPTCVLR